VSKDGEVASASVVKDAGDDPDVTNGAEISARLRPMVKLEPGTEDYLLEDDSLSVVLRCVSGVGVATREGVDVPVGKWAVNPIPRKMILENLSDSGIAEFFNKLLLEISVRDGAKIAVKTLNPTLGIVGGVSILGTTGIVVPYSHKAYIDTIEILMRNIHSAYPKEIVLCTGAKTLNSFKAFHPEIPEVAFIRIADFIAESLELLNEYCFKLVHIVCMPGKLFKYSRGFKCTHAHRNSIDMSEFVAEAHECGLTPSELDLVTAMPTVRGALNALPSEKRLALLRHLKRMALARLSEWMPPETELSLQVVDFDGTVMEALEC